MGPTFSTILNEFWTDFLQFSPPPPTPPLMCAPDINICIVCTKTELVISPQKLNLGEYEIKATSSYVRYMQIETSISFKPRDQRVVRSFLKDISHTAHNNFFKEKNSEDIVFPRGMFFVSMFDIGQISDL